MLADIDRRIQELLKNYSKMTQDKIGQMRQIEDFNRRVEVIGLKKIEVNDVNQVGNRLNQDVIRRNSMDKRDSFRGRDSLNNSNNYGKRPSLKRPTAEQKRTTKINLKKLVEYLRINDPTLKFTKDIDKNVELEGHGYVRSAQQKRSL